MGKVQKSLRLEEELCERAKADRREGESEAATFARLIAAGLDASAPETGGATETKHGERPSGEAAGLVAALQANIEDLRGQCDTLKAQLAVKDGQIEALQGITANAQALHGATDVLHAKQLESGTSRRGWFSRIFQKQGEERGHGGE